MVMLVPAFFMILLVGWVLDHLFIEEADERSERDYASLGVTTAAAAPVVAAGGRAGRAGRRHSASPGAPKVKPVAAGSADAHGAARRCRRETATAAPKPQAASRR